MLVPEAGDDDVGAANCVRFIAALGDALDLAAAGFVGAGARATGAMLAKRARRARTR